MQDIYCCFAAHAFIYGQSDSTAYTLPQLKLELVENRKDVVYNFDNESNVFVLTDSMIYINPLEIKYSISTGLIKKILVRDGTYGLKGSAIGGAVGAGLGLILSLGVILGTKSGEGGTAIAVLPVVVLCSTAIGGLIGAIFGLATPYYETYNISGDTQKRKSIMDKVFKKHKLK
jgi:hypothetical protein